MWKVNQRGSKERSFYTADTKKPPARAGASGGAAKGALHSRTDVQQQFGGNVQHITEFEDHIA